MKLNFTLIFTAFWFALQGQSPDKFSYQSVVRDAQNNIVANSNVGVRISLIQGSATGTIVYIETHAAQTNSNGLFTIEVGSGTIQNGSFSNINWGQGPYYSKTEIDPNGGTNYSITGTSQMLSVPYALYAKNSGNLLNQWSHGSTAPSINQGIVGDYYLNTLTGDVYQKNTTSTWTLISNLMGPQGVTGIHGTNCWDINNNGINDSSEDSNNDGLFSALDCQGPQGATGPQGSSTSGAPVFIAPVSIINLSGSQISQGQSIPASITTLLGQNVNAVMLSVEFKGVFYGSSLGTQIIGEINAICGVNTYKVGRWRFNDSNYASHAITSHEQVILPVINGQIQFTFPTWYAAEFLKIDLIGYYP
jgi:hypothetical protein